eukprot:1160002-Pelagomonas_calceolata.AAC.2
MPTYLSSFLHLLRLAPKAMEKSDLLMTSFLIACSLRLALKPMGTGIYPVRIMLTSMDGLDTRFNVLLEKRECFVGVQQRAKGIAAGAGKEPMPVIHIRKGAEQMKPTTHAHAQCGGCGADMSDHAAAI